MVNKKVISEELLEKFKLIQEYVKENCDGEMYHYPEGTYEDYCEFVKTDLMDEEEYYQNFFHIRGHGTDRKSAEEILKSGINYMMPELERTTLLLCEDEEILKKFQKWPYVDAECVVLVNIPLRYNSSIEGLPLCRDADKTSVMYNQYNYNISPDFIIGFMDLNTGEFVENNDFKLNNPAQGIYYEKQCNASTFKDLMI